MLVVSLAYVLLFLILFGYFEEGGVMFGPGFEKINIYGPFCNLKQSKKEGKDQKSS